MRATGFAHAALAAALVAALMLAGCGATKDADASGRVHGTTLSVYVSVPLLGASRVSGLAVVSGARLALTQVHDQIGRYRIALKVLDDATAARGGWDPGQTTANVRTAVLDPTTIAYLGDLNSGASAIAIPVLNRAGIPQVSPTSSAVGLTSSAPGSSPGEPMKYYPTGVRTFARVVPNDTVQAIAQVHVQKAMGCRKVYVLNDGEVDGADFATSYTLAAKSAGLDLVGDQTFVRNASDYSSLAKTVAQVAPQCVLISANTESGAVRLTTQLAAAMPDVRIFGSAGLAESTYANPALGGIPLSVAPRVVLTAPTPAPGLASPSPDAFNTAFERLFGPPEPVAIFGYEGMGLLLSAIERGTDNGRAPAERVNVRDAIFGTRDRHSVLGTYSIQPDGDTTLRRYGVYAIQDGQLSFWEAIDA
jgi:branched-chain amino acid transport system substrate-binding protein